MGDSTNDIDAKKEPLLAALVKEKIFDPKNDAHMSSLNTIKEFDPNRKDHIIVRPKDDRFDKIVTFDDVLQMLKSKDANQKVSIATMPGSEIRTNYAIIQAYQHEAELTPKTKKLLNQAIKSTNAYKKLDNMPESDKIQAALIEISLDKRAAHFGSMLVKESQKQAQQAPVQSAGATTGAAKPNTNKTPSGSNPAGKPKESTKGKSSSMIFSAEQERLFADARKNLIPETLEEHTKIPNRPKQPFQPGKKVTELV